MRIKLKAGKQKELILLAKKDLTWRELSKKLNINREYLSNDIKRENALLKEESYNKLCEIAKQDFDEFIIERLADS